MNVKSQRPHRSPLVMSKSSSQCRLLLWVLWTTLSATICAQPLPTRPEGVQLGDPAHGVDITVSPSMTQCESFLVYYNITGITSPFIAFYRSDVLRDALLTLHPPAAAVGYIDWTCNIRAGHSLVVAVRDANRTLRGQDYIVRSGISSSCLTDVTTTYSLANYGTEFFSFTSAGGGYAGSAPFYEHGYVIR
jgi:hypothetical protein